ncbi:response regulator [Calycomorphotria hydatis]|uniref:Response regulator PleD n=1 Tax=Calycomorphotria hydatis TaxID=2528027 RepID=A0A517TC19_9PLAN|nr:Response regulator PleD [Calycomorphotria hydatis]
MTAKVLIADDNQQNCELLEAYLANEDCDILFASDGREALDVAQRDLPDVILLDIMMPKLSGYEVCQMLRQDPATASIPILMITALDEQGDIDKAVDAGCDDFLTKPINSTEIGIRVRSMMSVKSIEPDHVRLLDYIDAVESDAELVRS